VLRGRLTIEIEGEASTVSTQQVFSFHGQFAYNIVATEETIFLLTYSNN
jgi:hypothetical protein